MLSTLNIRLAFLFHLEAVCGKKLFLKKINQGRRSQDV